jgi:predicted phosphodiesterase
VTIWGVLSDAHGNLPLLERAVAACRARGATRFAVLGDNLGRGDNEGCVALVRELADVAVVGNRDLDWIERVGEEARGYLLGLPAAARAEDFVAAHGDARLDRDVSTDDIRRAFARTRVRLGREGARLALFGHSHRARVWRLLAEGGVALLHDAATDPAGRTVSVASEAPDLFVVNVGTVGLPFPGKGPPSCAVYDTGSRTVEIVPLR